MTETETADGTTDRTAGTGRSILHYYLQDELGSPLRVSGYDTPYSRQGKEQPFSYTGYRHDEVSGTYFAKAREY